MNYCEVIVAHQIQVKERLITILLVNLSSLGYIDVS
jgi:hypothetical protein